MREQHLNLGPEGGSELPVLSLLRTIGCVMALALGLAALAGGAEQQEQATYRVGPEDQISVTVARHPEFSGSYYVPADGLVNLPAVGQIRADGKTLRELSAQITQLLSQRLREPEVTVSLQTPRMQRVYVLGSVQKPGLYDSKPGWRVTEALAAAGGLEQGVEESDCKAVILRARSGERQSVPLVDALRGPPESNPVVESGDVITLEAQETIPVYVYGEVKTSGLYRLRKDTPGVVQAITLAGGATEDAALDRVTVAHLDGKTTTLNLLDSTSADSQLGSIVLQPGDLITVPKETARIAVLGYVTEPGFYPLKNGQKITLSDALAMAKGRESKRGEIGSVVVIRMQDGKQQKLVYDMHKFLKSGDLSQNPEIKAGDVVYVPQTRRPDWDFLVRSLTAIGILINPFVP